MTSKPLLIIIPRLKQFKQIEYQDKIIEPFRDFSRLSFAQNDQYIYEIAYFLKNKFNNLFKDEWCLFKLMADNNKKRNVKETNKLSAEEEWNLIETHAKEFTLDYELHLFALNILPLFFNQIIDYINCDWPRSKIIKKISFLATTDFFYNEIENKNELFVLNKDRSLMYNKDLKLYVYTYRLNESLMNIELILKPLTDKLDLLAKYISNTYNHLIIDTLLSIMNSYHFKKSLMEKFKYNIKKFNNYRLYEISYKDKIMNFIDASLRDRNQTDYYTTTISATYMDNYLDIPKYIMSVFGNNKQDIKRIQRIIGSVLIGKSLNYFILFYGEGKNSKSTLVKFLKAIFNDFLISINFEVYLMHKPKNLLKYFSLDNKRIVVIENINIKKFFDNKDKLEWMLKDQVFNVIVTSNAEPTTEEMGVFANQMLEIYFPFSFIIKPKFFTEKRRIPNLKIDMDELFTWIINGTKIFLKRKQIIDKIKELENNLCYQNSDEMSLFDPEDDNSIVANSIYFQIKQLRTLLFELDQ